jgi:hypothetical protein
VSNEPNDATDTDRVIGGVKYVGQTATIIKDWRGFRVPSCTGCAGATCTKRSVCNKLPNCRDYDRTDGRNLIFVEATEEKTNG